MTTRELHREEWVAFFNAFSRHYRGHPVTVQLAMPPGVGQPQTLARRLALVGLTAELENQRVSAIVLSVGDAPDGHLSHVVRDPTRVRVAQVTDGADEVLIIDAAAGPTTYVDFSATGLGRLGEPQVVTQSPDGVI